MGNSIKPHLENASKTGVCNLSNQSLTEFPEGLQKLNATLRTLNLSDNKLSVLPACIGQFRQLKMLNISNNRISSLPVEMGSMSKLETLHAANNQLTSLPATVTQLSALKEVSLAGNQLRVFPVQLCALKNLNVLDLSHNRLVEVPSSVKDLNVIELNLSQNQISQLSESIAQCPRLKVLRAEENCLELRSFTPTFFRTSHISLLALEGNVFDEKSLRSLEGYDAYMERYTAARKKL
jgi:Leucine-rich repeat (LRR) protein